jgi:predicted RNase H-like nuclease (RuvC/YqgF family)
MEETADLVKRGFRPPAHVVELDRAITEADRLSIELKRAYSEIRKANHHLGLRKQNIESLTADLEVKDAEISGLRSKLTALQAEHDITRRLWGDATAEAMELGLELIDKDQEIQALRRELQELREGKG